MSFFKSHITSLGTFSMRDLDMRHKIRVVFELLSLIPFAIFSFILLEEHVLLELNHWLLMIQIILCTIIGSCVHFNHSCIEKPGLYQTFDQHSVPLS